MVMMVVGEELWMENGDLRWSLRYVARAQKVRDIVIYHVAICICMGYQVSTCKRFVDPSSCQAAKQRSGVHLPVLS